MNMLSADSAQSGHDRLIAEMLTALLLLLVSKLPLSLPFFISIILILRVSVEAEVSGIGRSSLCPLLVGSHEKEQCP